MGELQLETKVAEKVSSYTMRKALKAYFAHPAYGIVFEVARSTGFAANRHLDAIAMSLYPSRGLELNGIEIKVDRGDWRRELKAPDKAEEMAAFCDYFWIAAPAGVVPVDEVPVAWGLLEYANGKVAVKKRAQRTEVRDGGRPFLAAVFRAASRRYDPIEAEASYQDKLAAVEKRIEEGISARLKSHRDNSSTDAEKWRNLCKAIGESHYAPDEQIAAAVKLVHAAGVARTYGGLENLLSSAKSLTSRIEDALTEYQETTSLSLKRGV